MHNLQAAKDKIIQKLQETEEESIIRSIQRLLNMEETEEEQQSWESLSLQALAHAYGEEEPDYGNYKVQEPNVDYKS